MTRQGPLRVLCTAAVLTVLSTPLSPAAAQAENPEAKDPSKTAAKLPKKSSGAALDDLTFTFASRAQIEVRSILRAIGIHQDCQVLAGPRIKDRKLESIGAKELDYKDVEALLRSEGILVCWEQDGDRLRLHAVEERDAYSRLTFAPVMVKADESLPNRTMLVTACYPVRDADGMALFSVLRALASRDRTRLTELMYHRESSMLIVRGLTDQVGSVLAMAKKLDLPQPELRLRATVVELPLEAVKAGDTLSRDEAIKAAGEGGAKLDAIVKFRGQGEVRAVVDAEEVKPGGPAGPIGSGTIVLRFKASGASRSPELETLAIGRFHTKSTFEPKPGEVCGLYQARADGRLTLLFVERLPMEGGK